MWVQYVNPMGYMTQCATIWLTVLIAVNRYVAICHPFKADRFLTIRTARIQVPSSTYFFDDIRLSEFGFGFTVKKCIFD